MGNRFADKTRTTRRSKRKMAKIFLPELSEGPHSTWRGYIPLAIKAISVAVRKKGLKNPSRYTTLNILVSSCRSRSAICSENLLPRQRVEYAPLSFIFSRGEEEILKAYVSRALGKDEAWSETKGPDGRGGREANHLPGCNLKREPTGTDRSLSSGIISTLLRACIYIYIYLPRLFSSFPSFLETSLPRIHIYICTVCIHVTFDIFDCFLAVCRDEAKRWIKLAGYIFIRIPEGWKEVTSYFTFNEYSWKKGCLLRIDERLGDEEVKKLFDVNLSSFLPSLSCKRFVFRIKIGSLFVQKRRWYVDNGTYNVRETKVAVNLSG